MNEGNPSIHVNEVRGFRRLLIVLLSAVIRLWQRTLRFEYTEEAWKVLQETDRGVLFLVWHNRLFSSLEVWRRARGQTFTLHGLVSASRDGAILSVMLENLGVVPVRGSSSRRGAPATRELVKILDHRGDVGITVDGPRGPCYEAHPGMALLAKATDAPVVLYSGQPHRAFRFRSWDRFQLPWPFTRIDVRIEHLPPLSEWDGQYGREEVRKKIEDRLRSITPEAVPGKGSSMNQSEKSD